MIPSHISFRATLLTFFLALTDSAQAHPSKPDTSPNEIRATSPNLSPYRPVLTDGTFLPAPSSHTNPNNLRHGVPPLPDRNPQIHNPGPRDPKLHLRLQREHPHLRRRHRSPLQRRRAPPHPKHQPRPSGPEQPSQRSGRRHRRPNRAVRPPRHRRTPLHRRRRADLGPVRRGATAVRVRRGRHRGTGRGECGTAGLRGCGLEGADGCGGECGVDGGVSG